MSLYDDASLVMIPSGYKDGKLYSVKPSDGAGDFTFTRGSNLAATRVDENGLIEKGRENVLLQSNQFDTTWSLSSSITVTGGQSGYDGSNDAWLLKRSDASARYINQSLSLGQSVYTYSVYAKAESVDWLLIWTYDGSGSRSRYFDLANGVAGATVNGTIDVDIQSVGNGWYRCSITYDDSIIAVRLYPAVDDGNITGGISPAGIYIQDAQVESGLVATPYIETTTTTAQAGILEDMPRLDYSGGTCPALLLEPQRTNILPHSEYFGASDWIKTRCTITDDYAISPEGVQNAALMTATDDDARLEDAFVLSGDYTQSIWVKSGQSGDVSGQMDFAGLNIVTFTANQEWQRIHTTSDSLHRVRVRVNNSGDKLLIYGAQLEAGSYPTSYIPTYGTSVTRGVDLYEKTSATSLIGQEQGVLFVDFVPNSETATQWVAFLGSGNKYIAIYISSSRVYLEVANITNQAGFLSSTIVKGQRYKCAIAYAENDFAAYVNGVQVGTDSSGSVPAVDTIRNYYNTSIQSIDTNQLALFKTRLSNTDLATLTTL